MIAKTIFTSAIALAIGGSVPAFAQASGGMGQSGSTQSGGMSNGGMQSGGMQSGSMQDGSMAHPDMPKMTKAQMRSMKKCQAMSPAMMAKNKTCAKMMQMHPNMGTM